MSYISSDLYEEILKPNKSHTNCIVQIVLCKTVFISQFIFTIYMSSLFHHLPPITRMIKMRNKKITPSFPITIGILQGFGHEL